ncbi:elongation factor P maturation arginine rhamnosyltransferase EarP [Shewanella intestini]|uniref:Protein-arginine rhamnosyltransferase n=1 Tax=Shewanella intestini TaxID=2017544 RepID=A0ABS5I1W2_9GAMM|nr:MULTISPECIES: elongation factor P maturation arginine rhamnosyltransferase EarP [Shewanella]MBR9727896.1 elongation factor P maturation arginine rhamnosyltransferase EarP [Shewanella intestini]MRG36111.1 elongation factor P maturation arginine rhamnosyltransferase EarP [Shewanella sp. XMDDZSB0408]
MNTQRHLKPHWDIFCVVVDNYGDIGVTWRLAKQLVDEHQISVVLWVDDLHSFGHILPSLNPNLPVQYFNGIKIIHWNNTNIIAFEPGQVLIEAFACELPSTVINSLITLKDKQLSQPIWLNLEYLSAETWVDGCHGLPSLQANGLKKWFYFPGFTDNTGGLLREQPISKMVTQWQTENKKQLLFTQLGLTNIDDDDIVISVFSYETPALESLLNHFAQNDTKVHFLVPKGRSLFTLLPLLDCAFDLKLSQVQPGSQYHYQNAIVHVLPMTDQQGYDQLLWSCDINIVRGEDSFLRAQWAGKPFIWHIYPQEDDYHFEKLNAFLDKYCQQWPPALAVSYRNLVTAFNEGEREKCTQRLHELDLQQQSLQDLAQNWAQSAINETDLTSRLVQFIKSR